MLSFLKLFRNQKIIAILNLNEKTLVVSTLDKISITNKLELTVFIDKTN